MIVKLPGNYTGAQIIEAFEKALRPETNWSFEKSSTSHYEPGSVRRVETSKGLGFNQTEQRKTLFTRKTKIVNCEPFFEIGEMNLNNKFSEIEINMTIDRGVLPYDVDKFEEFVKFGLLYEAEVEIARKKFESLLGCVYENLGYRPGQSGGIERIC